MKKNKESRRSFLKKTGIISTGFIGLQSLIASQFFSCNPVNESKLSSKYGPLIDDPKGKLNLPKGFSYKLIAKKGREMSDGLVHPGKPDGMATFEGSDGKVIIVRNHELMPEQFGPFGKENELISKIPSEKFYDFGNGTYPSVGGTTTLVFNEETQEVEKSFLSLVGTIRNCAGGPTPWNSWITCEEFVSNAENGLEKDHGYCFEVPASEEIGLAEPMPLKAMGKFNHEAVCVDPRSGIVYLTEDRKDGLFYRFIPNVKSDLKQGGQLQALVIKGEPGRDTRNWPMMGKDFPMNEATKVEWMDLEDIDSQKDNLRKRGFKKGAAKFARGEGIWFGENELYFACTNGGKNQAGQIFRYKPSLNEGTTQESIEPGLLELYLEPNNTNLLKSCDNLTVAPWGDLMICEDDPHPFIVGVTKDGELYRFGENVGYQSEFAGGVFSPSGKTYFVNIQGPGLTFAIQGPWQIDV
jgi:secreted PhoX family phosphatase